MTFGRLLLHNLVFHRRGNLAVFLGVAVGAAVLTGALLVGDSLRDSLRELTERRLGPFDHALVAGRFFRAEVADRLAVSRTDHVSPALLLQGAASRVDGPGGRVNKVVILGVDERFWPKAPPLSKEFWRPEGFVPSSKQAVVLSADLARDLGVRKGDRVALHLEKVSAAPRETFLGKRKAEDVLSTLELAVADVLPADSFGSAFSLSATPAAPRNAYLPLAVLQQELTRPDDARHSLPRHPANALLVQGGRRATLQAELQKQFTLPDWGLEVRKPRKLFGDTPPGYISLESKQMFVEPAALKAVESAKLTAAPTLVYMVNNLATVRRQLGAAALAVAPPAWPPLATAWCAYYGPIEVPYAVVAALDPTKPSPLGPFLPSGKKELGDDEILLVQWEGSPLLRAKTGELIALTYFQPGEEGRLLEETKVLRLAGEVPLKGPFRDRNLTPKFPGITDVPTMADWKEKAPFPFDELRLSQPDRDYWTAHKATPKAYVTLKTGQKLWGSRFGAVTSVRLVPPSGDDPAQTAAAQILAHLRPEAGGFVFDDVRRQGLDASAGGVDFGMLFLGFSFFLIAAALLLVGLLFRLNLDRRASEIGLLLATGWRRGQVRRLLLAEGAVLALTGALVGLGGAVLYSRLMLDFLTARWPGGLERSILQLYVTPASLAIGYAAAVLVSLLTIVWATRVLGRVAPRALLLGETSEAAGGTRGKLRWSKWLIGVGLVGAAGCFVLGTRVHGHEEQAGSFFGSGALLLTAGLAAVWVWLRAASQESGGHVPGLLALGVRNAARNPVRSLLTVGLLAAATFLVVAVESFHRDPGSDFLEKTGGSGGFPLLAEAEVPIYQDLNSDKARIDLGFSAEARAALRDVRLVPFRVRAGDDASCLNLYQPRRPRLLGVPPSLLQRGGFQFDSTEAKTPAERANPWLLLKGRRDGAIPVFGETNTVGWMLHSGLGQELTVPDGRGNPVKLRFVGLLKDSVFQGELLMSEENFLALYPRQEGYQFFLVDIPPARADEVKTVLAKALADHGLSVELSARRLESYLAVENTYLATFQALGGLGLLLGALGLAVVLLRSVWERRGELALLRALGFRRSALGWLVLAENAWLLVLGVGVGLVAALLAVAPQLLSGAGEVSWLRLLGLLAVVTAVGLVAGAAAVATTLRAPLLPALRKE